METISPTTDIIRYVKRMNGDDAHAIPHVWIRRAVPILKNLPDYIIRYIFTEILGYAHRNGYYIQPVQLPQISLRRPFNGTDIHLKRLVHYDPQGRFRNMIIKDLRVVITTMSDVLYEEGGLYSDPFGEESLFIYATSRKHYNGELSEMYFYNIIYDSEGNFTTLYCPNVFRLIHVISEKTNFTRSLINVYKDLCDFPEDYRNILYKV